MSTENNKNLLENSIKILTDLIAFKTISGEDNNSLINYCDEVLKKNGASSFKIFDSEKKRVNLFAIRTYRCSACFKRLVNRSF